jgi:hypothetical protein
MAEMAFPIGGTASLLPGKVLQADSSSRVAGKRNILLI